MATRYLLDSNTIIAARKGDPKALLNKLAGLPAERLCLSPIVLSELLTGAAKKQDSARARQDLEALTDNFELLPYGEADANAYARLRAALEAKGKPIGPMDMLIAAQALAHRLVVVTANLREFQRVPGLKCEDWMR